MIKNGKLFGKVNLFDSAILILILALIIAGATKFKTFDEKVDGSDLVNISYTFAINNVRDYTADAFVSGDVVYDSGTGVEIGIVKNIEKRPAKVLSALPDGRVKYFENAYRYDVTLLIETLGTVTDTSIYANKNMELKVGSEKSIETRYATTTGKILSINY